MDGHLHLTATSKLKPQPSTDGGIRARIQWQRGSSVVGLLARNTRKGYYKVEVAGDSRVFLNSFQLDASGGTDITKIGQYDLPKLFQPGDTFRLELRLLGDRLTVLVDGAVAIEAQDSHHAGPGNWGPTAGEGWFESAEVQTPLPAIAAAERWQNLFADKR